MISTRLLPLLFSVGALALSGCPDDVNPAGDTENGTGTTGDTTMGPATTLTTGVSMTTAGMTAGATGTDGSGTDDGTTMPPTTGSDDTTGGGGDCCAPHAGPGCDDQACSDIVCGMDAFCCAFEWDANCAQMAQDSCTACGGVGSDSGSSGGTDTGGNDDQCCDPTPGVAGCPNDALEACVCGLDDFCCAMEWDAQCTGVAVDSCGANCPVVVGDCCSAGNGAPGCDDATCEGEVCAQDDFCCMGEWDQFCANQALGICEICDAGEGDCCAANADAGCSDDPCVSLVCGYMGADSECCNPGPWDQACADAAAGLCEVCGGGPGTGDCCAENPSAGCEDMACNDAVCAVDPFCCNGSWDASCAAEAAGICTLCGSAEGDCCSDTGTQGCNDAPCIAAICGADGFDPTCCTDQWTQACADEAGNVCVACGAVLPSNCCEGHAGPGCDDATCETDVCAVDDYCCATAWDGICADEAAGICETCGGGVGDCCAANGSQGCDDASCVAAICGNVMGADPSCCTDDWAQSCADTAGMVCAGC